MNEQHTPEFEAFCDEQGFDYDSNDVQAKQEVRAAWLGWKASQINASLSWPPVKIRSQDVHVHNSRVEITCANLVEAALLAESLVEFRVFADDENRPACDRVFGEQK